MKKEASLIEKFLSARMNMKAFNCKTPLSLFPLLKYISRTLINISLLVTNGEGLRTKYYESNRRWYGKE